LGYIRVFVLLFDSRLSTRTKIDYSEYLSRVIGKKSDFF